MSVCSHAAEVEGIVGNDETVMGRRGGRILQRSGEMGFDRVKCLGSGSLPLIHVEFGTVIGTVEVIKMNVCGLDVC